MVFGDNDQPLGQPDSPRRLAARRSPRRSPARLPSRPPGSV